MGGIERKEARAPVFLSERETKREARIARHTLAGIAFATCKRVVR